MPLIFDQFGVRLTTGALGEAAPGRLRMVFRRWRFSRMARSYPMALNICSKVKGLNESF